MDGMHVNVGKWDAWARGALAVVCLIVASLIVETLVVSLLAALCAVILAATALTRSCPFYSFFNINTRPHPRILHR